MAIFSQNAVVPLLMTTLLVGFVKSQCDFESCNVTKAATCTHQLFNLTSHLEFFEFFLAQKQSAEIFTRLWNNFTMCVNESGCTAESITNERVDASYIADAYGYITQHPLTDFTTCLSLAATQSGFKRCDAVATTKHNYPYKYHRRQLACSLSAELLQCHAKVLKSQCSIAVTKAIVSVLIARQALINYDQYNISDCSYDYVPISTCDYDSYFYCSSQSTVFSQGLSELNNQWSGLHYLHINCSICHDASQ